MMFIEIEGTKAELQSLHRLDGIEVKGLHDVGGGRFLTKAYVSRKSVLDELAARGLTVRVTLDEDEVKRRIEAERELMKGAWDDTGPDGDGGGDPQ